MNLYVCIKRVPDTEMKVKLKADNSGVDLAGVKTILSPYDEFAVEEALRVKEKNAGSTVTAITAGPAEAIEVLRTALAMGCDNAIHIELADGSDSNMAAKAIAECLKKEAPADLIYFGKEAIDDGAAMVPQMVAARMGIPSVTIVTGIEYSGATIKCKREIEGGSSETVEVTLPTVIAASKGLNEPRYATLPNIMKAKKKEVKAIKASDLGVAASDQKVKLSNFQMPPPKAAGKKIEGDAAAQAKALVQLLHTEAKVV